MKTLGFCATIALAALAVAPVMAQETGSEGGYGRYGNVSRDSAAARKKAVELAAKDSKASLSAICYAVYQAVQADPNQADVVFAEVVAQREDWTSGQVYAIMRAVLMAHPDVHAPLSEHVNGGAGAEDAEGAGSAEGAEGETPAAGSSATSVTMADKLSDALYAAQLPAGTADAVAEAAGLSAAGSAGGAGADRPASGGASSEGATTASGTDSSDVIVTDMVQVNQSVLNGSLGGGVVSSEEIKEPTTDVPTPGPMSRQN